MMNGIEVLNQSYLNNGSDYANADTLVWLLILSLVLIGMGIGVACVDNKLTHIFGLIIIIAGFGLLFYTVADSEQPSDIKQYQVTISDDVSMVEFNERYDVIDVEGKIWTIVEKEGE